MLEDETKYSEGEKKVLYHLFKQEQRIEKLEKELFQVQAFGAILFLILIGIGMFEINLLLEAAQ